MHKELFKALDYSQWISENRAFLKPPVGNKVVWPDRDFIVMTVGGPNERTDFHVNETEEFFYQLQGDMLLKIVDPEDRFLDIPIPQGSIYLLPPRTPHSPQRGEGTVGLVIEQRRRPGQKDGLQWYCAQCTHKLYEEWFELKDIERQFQAVFERYYESDQTVCSQCGHRNGRKWN